MTTTPYQIRYTLHSFTVHDPTTPEGKNRRNGVPIRSSEDLYRFAKPIYDQMDADKEHFVVLCLNNKNRLLGFKVISTGSMTASIVHPREVFSAVLEMRAAAICFLHNHPAGDPMPSPEDIELTKRLKECAELFNIRCLDHIVLGDDRFFSFSDKGML